MPQQPKHNNWINLQDYLGVNEDRGTEMAQNVLNDGITQQAGSAQGEINQASSAFKKAADAGSNQFQNASDATDDDVAAHAADTTYKGPTDIGEVDKNLAGNVSDAVSRVADAGTTQGQITELGKAYGANSSSSVGGGALDSFLLSGSAGGGSAMQDLQDKYGHIGDQYKDATGKTAAVVQTAQTATKQNAAQWAQEGQRRVAERQAAAEQDRTAGIRVSFADRNNPAVWAKESGRSVQEETRMYEQFKQALHTDFGDSLRSAARAFSPVHQIYGAVSGGKKDPLDVKASEFNASVHGSSSTPGGVGGGNLSGGIGEHIWWGPDDYAVFRQMDPAQWAELQSLSDSGQKHWIADKRERLCPRWAINNPESAAQIEQDNMMSWVRMNGGGG